MKNQEPKSARLWLIKEFEERQKINPRFSLRSFARHIGMPSGRLSEIISGQRGLSEALGKQVATRLGYDPKVRSRFLALSGARKRGPKSKNPGPAANQQEMSSLQLTMDSFQVISDWQHFGILSLLRTTDFQNDPQWIAGRLGLSSVLVKAALERLERIGLVEITDGKITRTQARLSTSEDMASVALKNSHKQSLEQAISSLDEVAVESRDISSVTMAVSPRRLAQAKIKIRKFRRDLASFLECEDSKSEDLTEVYNLNIQLVPVTKLITKRVK